MASVDRMPRRRLNRQLAAPMTPGSARSKVTKACERQGSSQVREKRAI